MKNQIVSISCRQAAIIAGIGLSLIVILAPIGNFAFIHGLIVPEDAAMTAKNILASQSVFRIGVCLLLIVAVLDLVVAWALYILLKPVNKSLSLLTAWLRLAYAAIFGMALSSLMNVLQLLSGTGYLSVFEADQLHAHVMLSLRAFDQGWNLGGVFFGVHLLMLGYLSFRSGFIPKFFGILLLIAALGYLADSFCTILIANYNISISIFTFIGELLLIFWLLIKGSRLQEGEQA